MTVAFLKIAAAGEGDEVTMGVGVGDGVTAACFKVIFIVGCENVKLYAPR